MYILYPAAYLSNKLSQTGENNRYVNYRLYEFFKLSVPIWKMTLFIVFLRSVKCSVTGLIHCYLRTISKYHRDTIISVMDVSNLDTITIKIEPMIQEGDTDELPDAEKDIYFQNVNEEYLEYAEKIGHPAGKRLKLMYLFLDAFKDFTCSTLL